MERHELQEAAPVWIKGTDVAAAGSVVVSDLPAGVAGDIDATATAVAALAALIAGGALTVKVPLSADTGTIGGTVSTTPTRLAAQATGGFGAKITNCHASQDLYVAFDDGTPTTTDLTTTLFLAKLTAGQVSDWLPVANLDQVWILGSAAGTNYAASWA